MRPIIQCVLYMKKDPFTDTASHNQVRLMVRKIRYKKFCNNSIWVLVCYVPFHLTFPDIYYKISDRHSRKHTGGRYHWKCQNNNKLCWFLFTVKKHDCMLIKNPNKALNLKKFATMLFCVNCILLCSPGPFKKSGVLSEYISKVWGISLENIGGVAKKFYVKYNHGENTSHYLQPLRFY